MSVTAAYNWGLGDEYSRNIDKLISQYVRRFKCLPLSGIKELKNYINQLWIIQEETQDLAVNKTVDLISDYTIKERIKCFKEEGIFPWQI